MSTLPDGCAKEQKAGPSERSIPNIVFIQCDQLNAKALICYGGEVDTPNIDRLKFMADNECNLIN